MLTCKKMTGIKNSKVTNYCCTYFVCVLRFWYIIFNMSTIEINDVVPNSILHDNFILIHVNFLSVSVCNGSQQKFIWMSTPGQYTLIFSCTLDGMSVSHFHRLCKEYRHVCRYDSHGAFDINGCKAQNQMHTSDHIQDNEPSGWHFVFVYSRVSYQAIIVYLIHR